MIHMVRTMSYAQKILMKCKVASSRNVKLQHIIGRNMVLATLLLGLGLLNWILLVSIANSKNVKNEMVVKLKKTRKKTCIDIKN